MLDLECGRFVSAYADDLTVIVSDTTEIEVLGIALKDYEAVTGAKVNCESAAWHLERQVFAIQLHCRTLDGKAV